MRAFPEGASQKGAAAAAVTHREACRQADARVLPLVAELRGRGLSLRGIAAALTAAGIPTRQGWPHWHARQVARILERAAAVTEPADVQHHVAQLSETQPDDAHIHGAQTTGTPTVTIPGGMCIP